MTPEQSHIIGDARINHEGCKSSTCEVCHLLAVVDSLRAELEDVKLNYNCINRENDEWRKWSAEVESEREQIQRETAERDQLKGELNSSKQLHASALADCLSREAERDQLQERFDAQTKALQHHQSGHSARCNEVNELREENRKLRHAIWQFDAADERTPESPFCSGCDIGEWDVEDAPDELHDDACLAARAALADSEGGKL